MKQNQRQSNIWAGLPAAVIIGFLLSAVVPTSRAADITWSGAEDGTTMSHGGNWVGGVAPVPGTDDIIFSGSSHLTVNNDITTSAGSAFAGITFDSSAGAFTISGNTIFLSAGITNNSSNLQYIQAYVDLNGARYINAAAGSMQFDKIGSAVSTPTPVLIKDGANTITLSGTTDNPNLTAVVSNGILVLAKGGTTSQHAIGGSVPLPVYTNATVCIAGANTNNDQIYKNVAVNMMGGTFQLQNTNEAIRYLTGSTNSWNSIVENGLAGTTNTLILGENNNNKGIYNGAIRNGAAGVLNLEIYKSSQQQFGGALTYSGTTLVTNNSAITSRMIINGSHIGGDAYIIGGPNATQLAALNGSGIMSVPSINIGVFADLGAGGGLDALATTYTDTVGKLTISNALVTLATNTTSLDVQLNGTTAGSGYDQVAIEGTGAFSNNNANLNLTVGYAPAVGDKFTIVKVQGTNSANNVGIFSKLNGVAADLSQGATFVEPSSGKRMQISYRAEGSTFDMGAGNGNDIMLQVVPPPGVPLIWRGTVNNAWDVSGTVNWVDTNNVASTFGPANNAIFDDSGTNHLLVDLTTALDPTNTTVNATNDYVFYTSTAGHLTGLVVLVKTNTGTLSIVTDNDNTGSTLIQVGTVQVGTNGTSGTLSGNVTINTNGTLAYNHSDDKVLNLTAVQSAQPGTGGFVHNGSGQLTITSDLSTFTGNTTNTGGLLQFGDGNGTLGQIGGTVTVPPANTVGYNFNADANINNAFAGSGTVNIDSAFSDTLTLAVAAVSSNFNGTINLLDTTRLHAQNGSSYADGNGSTVNVPAGCQAWCDNASTPYNSIFNIAGTGWTGTGWTIAQNLANPGGTGAISVYSATFTGAINLMADARIGGTITGGTIRGAISGPHQLEVWGNLGSYVLSMGPTNGVHSYASTLLTSGTIRALNPNAISTGPLALDYAGDFQLNSNNLTVANLTSVNNYSFSSTNLPTVRNFGSTPATLTVGSDNIDNLEFDGVFLDGGTGSLGLTKVGTGKWTLTAASTNTGIVAVNGGTLALSGSGSFANASKILANATLDVTGIGGMLTLTSGQTLGGNGNVTGAVTAPAGSTVSPGASVGTLTVSGNVTLSGKLLMELNRTNSPSNCDHLVSSGGSITYGGSLLVTNIGPALHTNDTFQVFPSGVTGFGANVTVATTDATGSTYTWQNSIATLGSVKVLGVIAPVNPMPGPIQFTVTGGNLNLAWPTNAGWTLMTNGVGLTATNQWFPYPNSANLTSVSIPMSPLKTNVFFRLQYPYP